MVLVFGIVYFLFVIVILLYVYRVKANIGFKPDSFASLSVRQEKKDLRVETFKDAHKYPFTASLGTSILSVYGLDLASNSFCAEGYVWIKYQQVPDWLRDWDPEVFASPIKSLTMLNAIERHDLVREPSLPEKDDDGEFIQWLYFSGKFHAPEISLRLFPFEVISLPIVLEFDDFFAGESVVELSNQQDLLARRVALNGYSYKGSSLSLYHHSYPTNWGYAYAENYFGCKDYSEFISVVARMSFKRNRINSLMSFFVPLLIVMSLVCLTPLIPIQDYATRLAMPASALLVLIFLKDEYKKVLPAGLNYPTIADLVYLIDLFISLSVFVHSLIRTKTFLMQPLSAGHNVVNTSNYSDIGFFWLTIFVALATPVLFYLVVKARQSNITYDNVEPSG